MLCGKCCRLAHKYLPFHRIEGWNGKYFRTGALWEVGVKLHIGHNGDGCRRGPQDEHTGVSMMIQS